MDTRLKERLVGAIVLVAIVVIVVPELLTGQRVAQAPVAQPGEVPVRTVTINLNEERAAIEHPAAPPPSAPPAAASAPAEARVMTETPAETPAVEGPGTPAAATPEPEAPKPAAPAESGTPAPVATPPPHASHAVTPAAAPVAHAAAPAPPRPSTAARGEAWVVQLGSFAQRANAEKLAASLRARSYSAFVSEFRGSGRVLYRVRVGPEQDRARADAIAARLAREGHPGSVAPES